jgi:hypothetical protein
MTSVLEGSPGDVYGTLTSSSTLTPGSNYYIAMLTNFTGTTVEILCPGTGNQNHGPLNGHYLAGYFSSQGSMPASITPSSITQSSSAYFLYAR